MSAVFYNVDPPRDSDITGSCLRPPWMTVYTSGQMQLVELECKYERIRENESAPTGQQKLNKTPKVDDSTTKHHVKANNSKH